MHADASIRSAESNHSVRVRSKVWLEVDGRFAVGEGGIALLEGIEAHGSVRQAAATVSWSYRHAWDYLRRIEAAFGIPLIETTPHRPHTGTRLTAFARLLLRGLQHLQTAVQAEANRIFRSSLRSTLSGDARRGGRISARICR